MKSDQWPGLVTNASPFAIPPTAAVEQLNLAAHVPGQVSVRGGIRKVSVFGGSPDLLDCFPYEQDGKATLIVMRPDGSIAAQRSPSYGWQSRQPFEPRLESPGLVTTGYTYRYVGGGEDTYVIPDAEYDPGTDDPDTDGCDATINGGSANPQNWEFTLDSQTCEATILNASYDGGTASETPDCYEAVSMYLCDGEDGGEDGGGRPPVPGATVPSAPTSVLAIFGPSSAVVRWEAPASDGGAQILEYNLEMSMDGGGTPSPLPGELDPPVVAAWGNGSARVLLWTRPTSPPSDWTFEWDSQQSVNGGVTWTPVTPTLATAAISVEILALSEESDRKWTGEACVDRSRVILPPRAWQSQVRTCRRIAEVRPSSSSTAIASVQFEWQGQRPRRLAVGKSAADLNFTLSDSFTEIANDEWVPVSTIWPHRVTNPSGALTQSALSFYWEKVQYCDNKYNPLFPDHFAKYRCKATAVVVRNGQESQVIAYSNTINFYGLDDLFDVF
jgi:hypothetical protein